MTVLDLMTMLAQCPLSARVTVCMDTTSMQAFIVAGPHYDRSLGGTLRLKGLIRADKTGRAEHLSP